MARRNTVYDDQGNFKSGSMEDYDRVRRLREQEQRAADFQDMANPDPFQSAEDYQKETDNEWKNNPELRKKYGEKVDAATNNFHSKQPYVDRMGGKEEAQKKRDEMAYNTYNADRWRARVEQDKKAAERERPSDKERDKKYRPNGKRRLAWILGGAGGAGLVGGLGLFSMTLGPMQFVHLSHLLTGRDWAGQETSDDDRLLRLMRYWRFASQGQVERTRLGYLGNKYGDRYEARLNATGWKSGYSAAFGFFDGFVIDRSHPDYRGMNDQQLARHIKEKDGIDVKWGRDYPGNAGFKANTPVVPVADMRYAEGRRAISNRLKEAGVSKLSAMIGSRILMKRGGGTSLFHPLKKLDEKVLRQLDKLYVAWKERRLKNLKAKRINITTSIAEREGASDSERAAAAQAQAEADDLNTRAADADTRFAAGDESALTGFRNTVGFKVAAGAAGGIGAASIPCILDSLADNARDVKQESVIKPLKRMAVEYISLGEQVESGHDFDAAQLGPYHDQSQGVNSRGEKTTIFDADILRTAYTGELSRGNPPDATLQTVGKGTPFDFLNEPDIQAVLNVLCSSVVQGAGIALSFITGPVSTAVGTIVAIFAQPHLEKSASDWMNGNPVNIFDKGADLGNDLPVGSMLASNDWAMSTGGTAMSREEEERLGAFTQNVQLQEFQSKSLAYRLFDTKDWRTPMSRFIDQQNTQDMLANIASAFGSLLNVGNSFGSTLFSAFSGKSQAVTQYYDFGFPKFGFPQELMGDGRFSNPYENASKTAAILDQPIGQDYVDRAKRCLGVTITRGSDGLWNVTSDPDSSPYLVDSTNEECNDKGESWLRIRFFIKDTVNANTIACFEDDAQACVDAGYSSAGSPGNAGISIGGNAKQLAQQILASGKVEWQLDSQRQAFEQIAQTGQQNKGLNGEAGPVAIAPELLAVIFAMSQKYDKIVLGTMAFGHEVDKGQHPLGKAVDINGLTKGNVTTGKQLHIDKLNAAQLAMVKDFYSEISNTFPVGTGALGQIDCFGGNPPPVRDGVVTFDKDGCDHLHVDVRKH